MTLTRLTLVILAICSIAGVSSRKLDHGKLENSLCSVNPNEFCSNFTTAAQCDAVKRCVQNDWSKLSPTSDDGSCTVCVQQIQNIRDGFSSNTSKEVIQDALDYVCELTFITRLMYRQCIKLIDTYVDSNINDLLDLLRSDVNPETICHLLDLCSSPPAAVELDDVAVYSDNIVLHFPATNDLQIFSPMVKSPEPTLLGAKKCTWGPSYWCSNLTSSKECNSVDHCIRTYWSKQQFEEDNGSVCQVCKDMVKQARDQLMSNETQEELKEVLEGSCKLIPLKEVRNECLKLADEFVPELTEVLASQMNPVAVCTVAGLCNSRRIDELLAVQTTPDFSTMDSCVNCTVAFTSFGRFMQSASKEDVLNRMLAVCSELSSYSDLCSSLIVSNFDDMYDLMNDALPPSAACHLSGMCAYRYHAHMDIEEAAFSSQVDTMLAVRNDDLPCDLCKQLVRHFQEILVANTTEAEFQQMLLGMCQQTGKFENECTKLVNDNFEVVYQFLTEELDPAKICADIQICPRSKNFVSDSNLNVISGRVIPILTYNTKLSNLMPIAPKDVTTSPTANTDVDSVECKFCHTIMQVVQSELENPKYDGDVKKVLERVCALVPSANAHRCDEFVDEYADTLIKILADETDPFVVCRLLKICPAEKEIVNNNALCPICQDVMHYIQDALQDPTDEKQIEAAVEKVCTVVPKAIANKCQDFISQYSALIINILSQEMDPSLVCPAMKLCPSSSPPEERCTHCRLLMADLVRQLGNNYELDHIKEKVNSLGPIKGLKNSVTAAELRISHSEDLIDMMTAEFEADESCFFMKFCDIQTIFSSPLPTNVIDGDVETNEISDSAPTIKPNCKICELFVHIYEKELTSNKTEEEIEYMFDRFCDKMKNSEFQKNCTTMVKKYVPVFLELLQKNVSPKELCTAAKFCSLNSLTIGVAPECRTCEVAVGSLESILGDPMMKENVFEEAVKICNTMEGKSRTVCTEVMNEVIPQVESVVFDIPPWFVCTKLKMCPYGIAIDKSACSNPKLWCQDKNTAFMCNKLNYCSKNVWSSSVP